MALIHSMRIENKHHLCCRCEDAFNSREALLAHYYECMGHNVGHTCEPDYATGQELTKHQIIHESHIKACACSSKFNSFYAMMVHWENGTCITNVRELHRLVLRFPGHGKLIVQALRGYLNGTTFRLKAADAHHFDHGSGKYICPFEDCGLAFEQMAHLDGHLKGPVHDAKLFRCPGTACDERFLSLSSLLEHIDTKIWREGANDGRDCAGSLWEFLMKEFGLSAEAPTSEDSSDSLL